MPAFSHTEQDGRSGSRHPLGQDKELGARVLAADRGKVGFSRVGLQEQRQTTLSSPEQRRAPQQGSLGAGQGQDLWPVLWSGTYEPKTDTRHGDSLTTAAAWG